VSSKTVIGASEEGSTARTQQLHQQPPHPSACQHQN